MTATIYDNRLTLKKEKRGRLVVTRYDQAPTKTQAQPTPYNAWAFSVPVGVFVVKIGRFCHKANSLNAIYNGLHIPQSNDKYSNNFLCVYIFSPTISRSAQSPPDLARVPSCGCMRTAPLN